MKIIQIQRDDFAGNKDSEGVEYFDYILNSLGIPEEERQDITIVELRIEENAFDIIRD